MSRNGLRRCWTPELEMKFNFFLNGPAMSGPGSFARRHVILSIRDMLKYDGRTREGKKAAVAAELRLAIATNDELEEIAEISHSLEDNASVGQILFQLKETQDQLRRERTI